MYRDIYITGGIPEDLERVSKSFKKPWGVEYFIDMGGNPSLLVRGVSTSRVLDILNSRFLPYGARLELVTEGESYEDYKLVDL